MSAPDAWLTKQQAAYRLQVSMRTVERLVLSGHLPQHRLRGGQSVRYRPEDVDALLETDSPEPADTP